jgi:small subunit ribosomal protein S1
MSEYLPEGKLILTQDNINTLHSFSLLSDAKKEGKILEPAFVMQNIILLLTSA